MKSRSRVAVLLTCTALLLQVPHASAETLMEGTQGPVEYGIIEGTNPEVDSVPEAPSQSAPDAELMQKGTNSYRIVDEWDDKNNRRVVLRERARDKIQSKHGLSANAPKVITKYSPNITNTNGGDRVEYRAPMQHIRCEGWFVFRQCKRLETRDVLTVVGFNKIKDGRPYGVVTTYCPGPEGRCPQWILNSPQLQ